MTLRSTPTHFQVHAVSLHTAKQTFFHNFGNFWDTFKCVFASESVSVQLIEGNTWLWCWLIEKPPSNCKKVQQKHSKLLLISDSTKKDSHYILLTVKQAAVMGRSVLPSAGDSEEGCMELVKCTVCGAF